MDKFKKKIIVRFFSIDATESFFESFSSNFRANSDADDNSRILDLRSKKHLIKLSGIHGFSGLKAYALTVVRERNTWQIKATSDGKIAGISSNQGIIGDPYFFYIIPEKKIILGFTSGPSGNLKSVSTSMLEQFNRDRSEKLKLNLIPKEKDFVALKALTEFSNLQLRIEPSLLTDVSDDAPKLIKKINTTTPDIESNMQLALDYKLGSPTDDFPSDKSVIELID